MDAEGPVPPDTVFPKARGGWYDIVVAMYDHVVKKVDSTLRGPIAHEVAAADAVYKPELNVFMPALPNLGPRQKMGSTS